jgi:hypothetical protein
MAKQTSLPGFPAMVTDVPAALDKYPRQTPLFVGRVMKQFHRKPLIGIGLTAKPSRRFVLPAMPPQCSVDLRSALNGMMNTWMVEVGGGQGHSTALVDLRSIAMTRHHIHQPAMHLARLLLNSSWLKMCLKV